MRILSIAWKDIQVFFSERGQLIVLFLLPMVFVIVFSGVFSLQGAEDKSIALGLTAQPDGTWYGGMKIDNNQMWEEVKQGNLRGFSIEGFFRDMSEKLSMEV